MVGKIHDAETLPKYVAIAETIRQRIAAAELNPHTLLPSERELSEAHSVSRMTARQALSLLESEGLVYRRPPRGTFVAEARSRFNIGSLSDELTRLGKRAAAEVLWSDRKPMPPDAVREEPSVAGPAHATCRIRLADEEPVAIETTYFAADLTPGLLGHDLTGSIWQLLTAQYDIVPSRARVTIRSVVMDAETSRLLGMRAGSAGTLLTRWAYDQHGRCFEFAHDVYRADRTEFEFDISLKPRL